MLPAEVDLLDVQVTRVPLVEPATGATRAAQGRELSLPSVAVAHGAGHLVVAGWVRSARHPRVHVLASSSLAGSSVRRGQLVGLTLPPGSGGSALLAGEARSIVEGLPCWVPCEGMFAPLSPRNAAQADVSAPFDDLVAMLPRGIGRLVVARPRPAAAVRDRMQELSLRIGQLQPTVMGQGSQRLDLERAEEELRLYESNQALGLWDVELWVGGASKVEARANAALLAECADLADQPVRLRTVGPSELRWSTPFVGTSHLVAGLVRAPLRELPGVRMVELPSFDVAPEHVKGFRLGDVLDGVGQVSARFRVPPDTLNRHVFVCGATGSGKSQTVRHLLEQVSGDPDPNKRVPWLVVEPAKAEYRVMAGRLTGRGDVTVIRPGAADEVPASLNPLEPTHAMVAGRVVRFPLQTHLDLVRALFVASFEATEPFPQILAAALTRSYEDLGWNLALDDSFETAVGVLPRWPTLADLQRTAIDVVEDVGYGEEVRNNVRGFVDVRLGSLRLGTPGRFFEGGHPLDLESLVERNAVFEIEDVGDDKDKAFFIGTVIIRLFELFRLKYGRGQQPLRHLLVLEEAHRLLRAAVPGSPSAHSVEIFANLLAEVRAYGQGIVVAEQIPAKIIPDVVKNSALKVMHRLPAEDDRAFVGGTMNLDQAQSRYVVALERGQAAVHADGMDRPMLVQVPLGVARENDDGVRRDPPLLPRSTACPSRCAIEPCSLRQLLSAGELAGDPRLTLFVETTTIAHLVGEPVGVPGAAWLGALRRASVGHAHTARALRCAVGQCVDTAVRSRSRYIQGAYDPSALKAVVADAVVEQLRQPVAERIPDVRWRVGEYRWRDVVEALQAPTAGTQENRPHPDTDIWRQRGLRLTQTTIPGQLYEVFDLSVEQRTPHRATLLGKPSALEAATSRLSRAASAVDRLMEAASFCDFRWDWHVHWLYRCTRAQEAD